MLQQARPLRIGLLALAASVIAVACRALLDPWLGDQQAFVTAYAAVALAAWFGTWRAGLACAVLLNIAIGYFFVAPRHHVNLSTAELVGSLAFYVNVAVILFLGHQAARAIAASNEALERLRDEDRQKDEFLAQMAHELRNPLTPVRYAAALLARGASAAAVEQARVVIVRQTALMSRLLDDLLDLSRITRNQLELRREVQDMGQVVRQTAEAHRAEADAAGHAVRVIVPAQRAWVDGDPARLQQIVGNLLSNAAKFTPAAGRIDVELVSTPHLVELRVRDSGVGLSADMLPRVFDLFSQFHSEIAATKQGLGIGLSMVHKLVQLHGGQVEARSAGLGAGAEFVVRLPRAQAPAGTGEPLPGGAALVEVPPERMLVVDDNRDAADVLADLMGIAGARVRTAYDGKTALAIADEWRPSTVVLDIGLPDMTGIEVAVELRKRAWARDVFLVAVTGWGQEEDRRRTREAGFDRHLVKPVDADELLRVIASRRDVLPAAL